MELSIYYNSDIRVVPEFYTLSENNVMEKYRQIVFTKPNTAELLEKPLQELEANQVAVKTVVSTISCGTEKKYPCR